MSHQLSYRNVMATTPTAVQYVLNPASVQRLTTVPTGKQQGSSKQEAMLIQATTATGSTQLELLKAQNAELQTKLHHVNRENGQLNDKVERIRADLTDLKSIIERCNATLNSGMSVDTINAGIKQLVAEGLKKVRAKKSYSKKGGKKGDSNCSCCYVAEKPHACDWENCGKRFSQRAHLEAHRNVHMGARFQCSWPNCTKSFCRKYSLVEHEQIHRSGNPNTCRFPGCDKSFSTKYGLQRHQGNQNHQGY